MLINWDLSHSWRCPYLKVFTSLFSKSDRQSNARSVGRASQGAKPSFGRFSFVSFSFAPTASKEKRKTILN